MATLFEILGAALAQHKQIRVQVSKMGMLVNFPVDKDRRQTVKVEAYTHKSLTTPMLVVRVVSRAGFFEHHKALRQVLEFNVGKQRPSLMLSDDTDPPALDVVYTEPIDLYNESVGSHIWGLIREVGICADRIEKQFGATDEL